MDILAEEIANEIWAEVIKFNDFARNTIGKQLVTAADSISANIAEGYGRLFFKETKQFLYYGRGSLQETKSWLNKCKHRKLITEDQYEFMIGKLKVILLN